MTSLEAFRLRLAEKAVERGLRPAIREGRSYIIAAPTSGVACGAAVKLAKADAHPNPYGTFLHVEEISSGVWEVVIATD